MEIIFSRDDLHSALQTVSIAAASRNTLPILANVLISATDDCVQMAATNMEIGIKVMVPADVQEAGSITVPARKLADIVRELPSGDIQFSQKSSTRISISSGKSHFRVACIPADEFPILPELGSDHSILSTDVLTAMIEQTAFCNSTDEFRHFLNGVYFCTDAGFVRMVATDGKRLAVTSREAECPAGITAIIPTKAANAIMKTFVIESDVRVGLQGSQLVLATGDKTMTTRLIEGDYVDYEAVVTPTRENTLLMQVTVAELLSALKRVSLVADPQIPVVHMAVVGSVMTLSASKVGIGDGLETVEVLISSTVSPDPTGGDIEIRLNARYLMGVLNAVGTEEVLFKFKDAQSAFLIVPVDEAVGAESEYVIMPMRD